MLPQVLEPRFDQECFDVATRVGGVFKGTPRVRAIATARARELLERTEERLSICCVDAVFDHDERRSLVRGYILTDYGWWPVRGGRKVHAGGAVELPAPGQRNREQRARRCDEMRERRAGHAGHLSPQSTAEGHGPEERGDIDGKPPSAHPLR